MPLKRRTTSRLTPWWEAFDRVVRQPILASDDYRRRWDDAVSSRSEGDLANHGRVARDDPGEAALFEAMVYQRAHADAFLAFLEPSLDGDDPAQTHVVVGDIGCGAGTVAIALAEVGFRSIDYTGLDHHRHSRVLGRRMLSELGSPPIAEYAIVSRLGYLRRNLFASEFRPNSWVYLTSSYVMNQPGVAETLMPSFVGLIEDAADKFGVVHVVLVDAWLDDQVIDKLAAIAANGYEVEYLIPPERHTYTMRIPDLRDDSFSQVRAGHSAAGTYLLVRRERRRVPRS